MGTYGTELVDERGTGLRALPVPGGQQDPAA
jgi:hypothetical protein